MLISPKGFRKDGRRLDQGRTVKCRLGRLSAYSAACGKFDDNGAVYFEMGLTRVVAQIADIATNNRQQQQQQQSYATSNGKLSVSIAWAPFATSERRVRRQKERQTAFFALTIQKAFEPIIAYDAPHGSVAIQLAIISADGGILPALINTTTLALVRAGIPLLEIITASGVAFIQQRCLVDPLMTEIHAAQADMTVASLERAQTISVLICDSKVSSSAFSELLTAALSHNAKIAAIIRTEMRLHLERTALLSQVVSSKILSIAAANQAKPVGSTSRSRNGLRERDMDEG